MTQADFLRQLPNTITLSQGSSGQVILLPTAHEEVQAIVQLANTHQLPLFGSALMLDLRRLMAIPSHRVEEFMITVETGIGMKELTSCLSPYQQRFPLQYAGSRSLGSVLGEAPISLNATRHGALHRWVLGMKAITGDGESIHYGGEVVKNVTGYDMNKLFVGSQHRYGVITTATLKLLPMPEETVCVLLPCSGLNKAITLAETLQTTLPQVDILTLCRISELLDWQILLSFSGYHTLIAQTMPLLQEILEANALNLEETRLTPEMLDRWIERLDWLLPQQPDALVIRVALPSHQLKAFQTELHRFPGFESADVLFVFEAHQLQLRWQAPQLPMPETLNVLRKFIANMGGFVEILRSPAGFPLTPTAWHQTIPKPIQQWEKRLQQQFDPLNILQPQMTEAVLV